MANSVADTLFPEKPEAQLRVYAWEYVDPSEHYRGLIKVGKTTKPDVNDRIKESQGQAQHPYRLLLNEVAERDDGSVFTDDDIKAILLRRGIDNPKIGSSTEWYRCSIADVKGAIQELKTGVRLEPGRHQTFPMRPEQAKAVRLTDAYFKSVWAEDKNAIPRFLWNAKMRFGKTFATYELAKKIGAQRVLVVTFKPAVEGAWRDDLLEHVDFEGWQFGSKKYGVDPTTADKDRPLVYFGSFQDLLGRDKLGNIKANNEWLHTTNWDLVVFDEYHFGAWRENAKELFEGEDQTELTKELKQLGAQGSSVVGAFEESFEELAEDETEFLPITTKAYLYLSGTPFRALATGEFTEEQIFNWTYTDEQKAKRDWAKQHQGSGSASANPYQALPELRLMTYQMPDELIAIAKKGEFDEFDLNEFFTATGSGANAVFKHKEYVQKWLDIIRGSYAATQVDNLRLGASKPPFPYSDVRLLPYLNHSIWFLPNVAACYAMANLLERQNNFYHDYEVLTVAGVGAGVGLEALPPVRNAIKSGTETKTITLTCGKLTTGVTVAQWSAILMLRNLKSPETYFQAAFRVQSPWSIRNPNGDDPNYEQVLKPVCFVFDFAPTRALSQLAEYGQRLNPEAKNPETAVEELVNFLPVLAYDGSSMKQIDAAGVLDWALSGTTATMLARRWESAILVNVDNDTLRKIMDDPRAYDAVMNIEGFRALGSDIIETVINKSEAVKETKRKLGESGVDKIEKPPISEEEKEYRSKRKQIQEKLIKFATRIPAFMYLTDYRENTLKDVITKLDSELFKKVTGITKEDFNLLVSLGVFNATLMNQAVFQFRRYEDASLSYTGIESHPNLRHVGLYDTVITTEEVHDAH